MYTHSASNTIDATTEWNPCNEVGRGNMMLTDKLRGPIASRNITEAHFKALKLFRRCCRMVGGRIKRVGALGISLQRNELHDP